MEGEKADFSGAVSDENIPSFKKSCPKLYKKILRSQHEAIKVKGIIKTGSALVDFIDENYTGDEKSMKRVRENISMLEITRFALNDESFWVRAAEKLSYRSLCFLKDVYMAPELSSKFTRDSKILQKFIESLKTSKMEISKKKEFLSVLICFNSEEVKYEVFNCGNPSLIQLLFSMRKEFSSDGSNICSLFSILNFSR